MNTRLAPRTTGGAPSDREARLAALDARRAPRPSPPAERAALDARLAALSARRPTSSQPSGRSGGRTTPPTGAKRRHAAHGSRVASLGLSLASTGALAAFFAVSSGGSGAQVAAASIVAQPAGGTTATATATAGTAASTLAPTPTVVDIAVDPAPGGAAVDQTAATTVPTPATVPATVPTAAPAATVAVVQGGVFHNKWGDVQVQATFGADGSIVDVVTLQTPDRDGKSVRINDRAVPVLNSEALSAQNASVDTVSGATYTSDDYRRSLQSAIDLARQAGITAIA